MRNNLRHFTKSHRDKIGATRKARYASGEIKAWQLGKKMNKLFILKNMKAHLKYDVSFNFLNTYSKDIEKLKYLNRAISRKRDCDGFTTEIYMQYIRKFYYDEKFNELYQQWKQTGNKWIKPSLDHIQAKCKGGTLMVNNLQFVSWLENRAKIDIPQVEWDKMKNNIQYYL
jgi:hypothetical protein